MAIVFHKILHFTGLLESIELLRFNLMSFRGVLIARNIEVEQMRLVYCITVTGAKTDRNCVYLSIY